MSNNATLPPAVASHVMRDSLRSLVSGMGDPAHDKLATVFYQPPFLDDTMLQNSYASSWIAKKIVNIPAFDALRKGRDWQAPEDVITKIEAEEKRLKLFPKLVELEIKARLWGGAVMVIGTGEVEDYSEPFDPETVEKGGLTHLAVLTRRELSAGSLDDDITSENYSRPKSYVISGQGSNQVTIHPSRLVIRIGDPHPDPWNAVTSSGLGWGDSVLQNVYTQMQQTDGTLANVASLVFEANVDVFGVPDMMEQLSEADYRQRLMDRMTLNNIAKSVNRSVMRDSDETYERHSLNFASLDKVMDKFLLAVSGAADIPVTRFLGQSPAGLSSTGDGDMKNYYDRITSIQELDITPSLYRLDEALIRSATGERDPDIHYNWSPLELLNEKDQSEINKNNAVAAEAYSRMGIFDPNEMRVVVSNQLIENGVYPGLAAAMDETGEIDFGFDPAGDKAEAQLPSGVKPPQEATDAAPKTLYVRRGVKNADEIIAWAKEQGFEKTLTPDDLHVTIAFSRASVDWFKVGEAWDDEVKIGKGGARMVERLGETGDAVVLLFANNMLNWRHKEIIRAGATWDWPDYQPHITIAYDPDRKVNVEELKAYTGEIILTEEIFEELDLNWKSKVRQT